MWKFPFSRKLIVDAKKQPRAVARGRKKGVPKSKDTNSEEESDGGKNDPPLPAMIRPARTASKIAAISLKEMPVADRDPNFSDERQPSEEIVLEHSNGEENEGTKYVHFSPTIEASGAQTIEASGAQTIFPDGEQTIEADTQETANEGGKRNTRSSKDQDDLADRVIQKSTFLQLRRMESGTLPNDWRLESFNAKRVSVYSFVTFVTPSIDEQPWFSTYSSMDVYSSPLLTSIF